MKAALTLVTLIALAGLPAQARAEIGAPGLQTPTQPVVQLAQRGRRTAVKKPKTEVTPDEMRIAAIVNNEVITIRDVATRTKFVMVTSRLPDKPEVRRRVAPQIMRGLIEERLKMQEAKRIGIKVSKGELGRAVARIEKTNNIPRGKLLSALRAQGIDPRTLLEQIQAVIAWRKVVQRKIRPRVRITNQEVNDYIARLNANSGRVRMRVAEIYLAVDTPDQDKSVRASAERLFEQIRKGVNFNSVARQFSQSATASTGGDLGWIDEGSLPAELDSQLRQMKEGQIVGPIRTVSGYYILALLQRRVEISSPKKSTVSLAQVALQLPVKASAADRKSLTALAKTISETASGCADMDKLSRELGATGSTRIKNVKVASLAPALRKSATSLPVGKASAPITTKTGTTVIMVCERKGITDRRQQAVVRRMLNARQLNILTRRYLRDLRRSAFLDRRV